MNNLLKLLTFLIFMTAFLVGTLAAQQDKGPAPQDKDGAGTPSAEVRLILDHVIAVQSDPALEGKQHRNERRIAIKKIIARNFYFDGMSQLSLGNYWDKLGKSEQSDFKNVFQDLFQDSYTKLVLDFLKREKIIYGKEEMKHGGALIRTRIARANEEIPVDYTLVQVKGKWLVQDVTIDGVSIADNYKRSFARVIQKESFKGLLQKMRIQRKAIEKSSSSESASVLDKLKSFGGA